MLQTCLKRYIAAIYLKCIAYQQHRDNFNPTDFPVSLNITRIDRNIWNAALKVQETQIFTAIFSYTKQVFRLKQ